MVESVLSAPALRHVGHRLSHGPGHGAQPEDAQALAGHQPRQQFRFPGIFQVLRLHHRKPEHLSRDTGLSLSDSRSGLLPQHADGPHGRAREPFLRGGDPAHRDFVPHVSIDELHHRRLPRHDSNRTQLHPLSDLCFLLSAARGRADRAGPQSAAPAPERAEDHQAGHHRWPRPLPGGLLQEGGPGRLPLHVCGQGLSRSGSLSGRRPDPGHVRLRVADLLRLQRLHRHGPRHSQAHGLPFDAELQQSLRGHRARRLLGALAHQPVHLVQGLRLLPAGRQSSRLAADLPEHVPHDGDLRHLARGQLDVRHLGRPACGGPCPHP